MQGTLYKTTRNFGSSRMKITDCVKILKIASLRGYAGCCKTSFTGNVTSLECGELHTKLKRIQVIIS